MDSLYHYYIDFLSYNHSEFQLCFNYQAGLGFDGLEFFSYFSINVVRTCFCRTSCAFHLHHFGIHYIYRLAFIKNFGEGMHKITAISPLSFALFFCHVVKIICYFYSTSQYEGCDTKYVIFFCTF